MTTTDMFGPSYNIHKTYFPKKRAVSNLIYEKLSGRQN